MMLCTVKVASNAKIIRCVPTSLTLQLLLCAEVRLAKGAERKNAVAGCLCALLLHAQFSCCILMAVIAALHRFQTLASARFAEARARKLPQVFAFCAMLQAL
jgi:hypothetical protein